MENEKTQLEYEIIGGIITNNSLLDKYDLDSKYFSCSKIFDYIKSLYLKYKYLNIDLITNNKQNIKAIDFITKCIGVAAFENEIYGKYKRLKEIYRDLEIDKITNAYKNREISYKEFNIKMLLLNKNDDFDEDEILTINDIKIDIQTEREYTNLKELDYLLKGVEYGKLSLWSGITNHGKTTLMIQFAKECIKKHKKIFYFSGEQTASEFKNYLYVGMCNKDQLEFITDKNNTKIYDTRPKQEFIEYFDNIYRNDIYIYNNNIPENNVMTMLKVMQKAYNQGVRIFFIDNFMQLDNSEKLEEQTKIVESFKRFARNNNCIINLVAHPRKTQFQKNRLTIFDISGTQNIANKSSNICTIIRVDLLNDNEKKEIGNVLARNDYDIEECDAIVEVLKTKGNSCKMVGLQYDMETKTYKEIPKKKVSDKER